MAIKTLSIPEDMNEFLNQNSDLSPSKMLQSKITEIRERRRLNHVETAQLQNRLKFMEKKLWEANDEITNLKEKNV